MNSAETTVTYPPGLMRAVRVNRVLFSLCRRCRMRKTALRFYSRLHAIEDGY